MVLLPNRFYVSRKLVRFARVIIFGCFLMFPFMLLTIQLLPREQAYLSIEAPGTPNRTILFWTHFYTDDFTSQLELHKEAVRDLKHCPVQNCLLTNNRRLLSKSDAVIFSAFDMSVTDLPANRSSDQYFIFYSLESPVHVRLDLGGVVNSYFNLTFTYRLDSDVVTDSYFQHFHPSLLNGRDEFRVLWMNKTKMASALISNCRPVSQRQVYLEEISRYFPIDVYGTCGNLKCPRNDKNCDLKTIVDYKFYFAFENSICKDYVTEKIHRAFNHGAIPVVYGAANYSRLFPPKSFINVLDFGNPRELAQYLMLVSQNWQIYEEYFKWRYTPDYLQLPPFIQHAELAWCKLCRIIHEEPRKHQSIPNLNQWWKENAKCSVPEITSLSSSSGRWLENPVIYQ